MPNFSFNKVTRIITVELPDTEVTVQQLINAIRDWEDDLTNIETSKVADASGKESLGGGLQVGITLKLLNWKVKFADRAGPDYVDCSISGGNLLAVDANNQSINPISPAAYVTVTKSTAVSAVAIAAVAEWTQAQKDQIFADMDSTKDEVVGARADVADVKTDVGSTKSEVIGVKTEVQTARQELDEAKHTGTESFDRDTESLEAIRKKLDALKVSVGKAFKL